MAGKEVVGIRQQVQVEGEARERGVRGFTIIARHDVLTHRLNQIAAGQERRTHLIGEDEGREIGVEADKRAREAGDDHTVNPSLQPGAWALGRRGRDGWATRAALGR